MKTTFTLLLIAMQAISLAAAGPTDLPLGVEVREEHGSLVVREVVWNPHSLRFQFQKTPLAQASQGRPCKASSQILKC